MRICERVTPRAVSSRTRRPPAQVQDQYETERVAEPPVAVCADIWPSLTRFDHTKALLSL